MISVSDPCSAQYILEHKGLEVLLQGLKCNDPETLVNVITTLLYLCNTQSKKHIVNTEVLQTIKELEKSDDKRLSNIVTIFLENFETLERSTK